MHPIDHRGMLIDELGTVSGHITPLAHVRRRHNARAQQPVLQQLRYPFTVFDIRLATRHHLEMARIDQQQVHMAFEDVPHRLPIHSRRFHRHMAHLPLVQPLKQRQQLRGRCREGFDLFFNLPPGTKASATCHHRLFVHIETTYVRVDRFHSVHGQGSLKKWQGETTRT